MSSFLPPRTHLEALDLRFDLFRRWMTEGTFRRLTLPAGSYGSLIMFLFMLVPPKSRFHNRVTRWATFLTVLGIHGWIMVNCRVYGTAFGFGMGITLGWGTIWAATLLIFNDGKTEFQRLERRTAPKKGGNPDDTVLSTGVDRGRDLKHRAPASNAGQANSSATSTTSESTYYVWQPYPTDTFRHRLLWNLELLTSFRGLGWNWCIDGVPKLPPEIEPQPSSSNTTLAKAPIAKDEPMSKAGLLRYTSRRPLLLHNIYIFIRTYLVIDTLKLIYMYDTYFWGSQPGMSYPPPCPEYLPPLFHTSPHALQFLRMVLSILGVWQILMLIFSLAPLTFATLGTDILGHFAEPYLYPDHFGSGSNIANRGLAGWWGAGWHQMFRYAFESAGRWVVGCLGLEAKSQTGKAVALMTAFAVSGTLHACGSMTALGVTHPIRGPFAFFMLQGVGVLVQSSWREVLKSRGLLERIPLRVGQVVNVGFALSWLYVTGPLLADDFARGGVWLSEPYPFSFWRLFGFGVEGDKALLWSYKNLIHWHTDPNPLFSGLAF